ncbi:MAG: hypothetical protein CMJ58_16985 [Planctomycetaceae bacterium]|nr:hypothetical protein [Planctomycetaceae bacterium]
MPLLLENATATSPITWHFLESGKWIISMEVVGGFGDDYVGCRILRHFDGEANAAYVTDDNNNYVRLDRAQPDAVLVSPGCYYGIEETDFAGETVTVRAVQLEARLPGS